MTIYRCSKKIIAKTIYSLSEIGKQRKEAVLFWTSARAVQSVIEISSIYVPHYKSASDWFWIDKESMSEMLRQLRSADLQLVAQVHTHPAKAFHSATDDEWAVVRKVGALSIVLPYFAQEISIENFIKHAAVFELNRNDQWTEVQSQHLSSRLEIFDD